MNNVPDHEHCALVNFFQRTCKSCRRNIIYIYKTTRDWCAFYRPKRGRNYKYSSQLKTVNSYIKQLRVDGYCVVENFWSKDKSLEALLEVDRILSANKESLHPAGISDMRFFGAEKESNIIKEFHVNAELECIASLYCNMPMKAAFTLAAKMPFRIGNNGSGEGWHRDTFWRQFKAIIYLTDVESVNGPFQLLCKSNGLLSVILDGLVAKLKIRQHRLSVQEVDKILEKSPFRLKTFTGRPGHYCWSILAQFIVENRFKRGVGMR